MEKLILTHGTKVYQADAATDGGDETNLRLALKTKGFAPAGLFGAVVFRRISLTVSHESGFKLFAIPYLDGAALYGNAAAFSVGSPAPGTRETVVLDIPLGIHYQGAAGEILSKGARGSNIQLYIETSPEDGVALYGPVHVENMQILYSGSFASVSGAATDGGGAEATRTVGTE